MNFCKCGCETIIADDKSYVHNHHFKGVKRGPLSEKHKQNISQTLMGNIPWNKGKSNCVSEQGKQNISKANKGRTAWNKGLKLPQYSGENGCNWIDGRSFKPYCKKFNEFNKEQIRNRDNRICQNCAKTELDNYQKLSVHHIHYDKENCKPDLITLCNSCNVKANGNRDYWEEYFMKKLKERNLLNYKLMEK
jgi:hypothetical protein